MKLISWAELKKIIDSTGCPFLSVAMDGYKLVTTNSQSFAFFSELEDGSTEETDYNDNYMGLTNCCARTFDGSGRTLARKAIAEKGSMLCYHTMGIETSNITSLQSKKWDNSTNAPEISAKFLKSGEIDCADQADADTNCIITEIQFQGTATVEMIDAELRHNGTPAYRTIFLQAVGAPHIPEAQGGQKPFCKGGYDLSFLKAQEPYYVDGRAPKAMVYDPTYFSHRLGIRLYHTAGYKLKMQLRIGYYQL